MALGVVCVVAFTTLVVRRTGMAGAPLPAFLALVAVFGPLWYSFGEGNTTHMVLLLLLVAMLACKRRRDFAAGALLGIAAVIKLPLLLFGVYYAARGRWRVVAGGATVLLLAGAVSLLMFGWPLHQLWHKRCIAPFTSRPMPAYNVQSIDGFLARLHHGPLLLRDWDPVKLSRPARVASKLAALALFAVAAIAIARAQHAPPLPWRAVEPLDPDAEALLFCPLLFCLVLALALTTSPLTWTHYHLYLLLPLALWLSGRMVPTLPPPHGHGLWLAAALLTSLPAVIIEPEATSRLAAITSRTVVSLHLLGALLCFLAIVMSRPHQPTTS